MDDLKMIPAELKQYDQWVNWTFFCKADQKLAKLPINPHTGEHASVSLPATWSSYATAVARCQAAGLTPRGLSIKGIGFVFTVGDPFAGVDFDHCRNPLTGHIDPLVLERITALDSYTEVSVSGTGMHVILQAVLSENGCRQENIEFYDRGRYFIVTGNHLPGFSTSVNTRQAELEALHARTFPKKADWPRPVPCPRRFTGDDATVLQLVLRSRQGAKFKRLLAGDWSGYPSQSEADLALCGILAFWTQDPLQIDQIFRSSALYRAKWDEPRQRTGLTYGELTIQKALGGTH